MLHHIHLENGAIPAHNPGSADVCPSGRSFFNHEVPCATAGGYGWRSGQPRPSTEATRSSLRHCHRQAQRQMAEWGGSPTAGA